MANRIRELQFIHMQPGHPMEARCLACGRVFRAAPQTIERTDDVVMRIRADFGAHNCNEDARQAAARIVREATEQQ
jgi:hypothetical protein